MERNFSLEITKKDKIYLSIISVLLLLILSLAICLPRPYKVVEKEVVVVKPIYNKVYDTEFVHIISPTSALYNDGYIDLNNNVYKTSFEKTLVDVGEIESLKASFSLKTSVGFEKKEFSLDGSIANLIINKNSLTTDFLIDSFIMQNIRTLFVLNYGEQSVMIKEDFLIEAVFKNATINFLVTYICE